MPTSKAFRFDNLRWINFQTAGDIAPLAKAIPAHQTIPFKIVADEPEANLARLKEAALGARDKFLIVTGHIEGKDFVSRVAGTERFRISVTDAIAIFRSAGARVFPVGCNIASLAGTGPTGFVAPRQVASAIQRARGARTEFEFLKQFVAKDLPAIALDISPLEASEHGRGVHGDHARQLDPGVDLDKATEHGHAAPSDTEIGALVGIAIAVTTAAALGSPSQESSDPPDAGPESFRPVPPDADTATLPATPPPTTLQGGCGCRASSPESNGLLLLALVPLLVRRTGRRP